MIRPRDDSCRGEIESVVRHAIERDGLIGVGDSVVVGVSGGADSVCLAHVLLRLSKQAAFSLHVAHLNHGIRGEDADRDAGFVRELAKGWGIPASIQKCDVPALAAEHRIAIEEAARRARYGFLGRIALEQGAGVVAVAHTADDQVETILMHWLRGSGLAGLRGMLPAVPLSGLRLFPGDQDLINSSSVRIVRPLLEVRRSEIEAYCTAIGVEPRYDLSNLDTTYFRNRVRHELIPLLESYQPRVREVLTRTGRVVAADFAALRDLLDQAWTETVVSDSSEAVHFDLGLWRQLPLSTKRSIIREAIHRLCHSLRNIDYVHVQNAIDVLEAGPAGTQVTLPRNLVLTIGYKQFWIGGRDYEPGPTDAFPLVSAPITLAVPGTTRIPGSAWSIRADLLKSSEYRPNTDRCRAFFDYGVIGEQLILRPRRSGDLFRPLGMGGHRQSVREAMISAKIPRAVRERVPLLESSEGIVWIVGYRQSEQAKVTDTTKRVLRISAYQKSDANPVQRGGSPR